jgi:N4-gp56 family major capsid protein
MANNYTSVVDSGSTFDGIPTNVLTFHTNDVLFAAMPAMRFDQFAVVRTDLQANPGDTISFSKYGNLTRGGTISEELDIESKSLTKTSVSIAVTEYGNAVGLTSKLLTLSFLDEMQNASITLGRDYALVTDLMLRDALFSATPTVLANSRTTQAAVTTGDTLKKETISAAVEILLTGNVMKYVDANGEFYVSYIHPHQLSSLQDDLVSIHQYAYAELIFKGEVGEYKGVRFIVSTNCPNGAAVSTDGGYDAELVAEYQYGETAAEHNDVDLYKAVVFGERAYGWAIALPVELRQDPGQTNFGRRIRVAWYAIMGAGIINDENCVILITS